MFSRRFKVGYLTIEGLNSFATVYYFYYFYFFMQKQFGFGNKANLALAALNGGTYAVCAFFGGSFAQRFGYLRALKLGFFIMVGALAVGMLLSSATGQVVVMVVTILGMSLTWPTLEALVSEGESRAGIQHMVGVYNVVWAATAAIGNFTGGAMLVYLGLKSLFYVPIAMVLIQLVLTFWLDAQIRRGKSFPNGSNTPGPQVEPAPAPEAHPVSAPRAKAFLRMAWLANPFAYIALNTLIALMPGLASRLGLSTALAGICGSVWCFSRLGAFTLFWLWSGWHYRFRWLALAYVALIATFMAMLLAPNVGLLVAAQLLFGVAIGLIYYSSLFYSMDLSEAKGEHGGIHEAVIGLGNFAGPAVGAAALQFVPQYAHSGAYAVTVLLLCGLGGLTAIWRSARSS